MRDESEQAVIHRLEAFSDIVIGFSLAQLAVTLVIPQHSPRDLFTHVKGVKELFGFGITFALVCAVWWSHHRLFRHLFVPVPVNIVANFAALGGVIFLAFSLQVLVRFGLNDSVAYAMYTGSYAWITLLFAAIAWNGLRLRRDRMTHDVRSLGTGFAIRSTIVAVWLCTLTALTLTLGVTNPVMPWLVAAFLVSLLAHRVITRRRLRVSSPSA